MRPYHHTHVGRIVVVYADVLQQARDLVLHEQLATL
jgi:hypothetical protein